MPTSLIMLIPTVPFLISAMESRATALYQLKLTFKSLNLYAMFDIFIQIINTPL